jgi:nucleotide-binding universal stress UspA family protein
VCAPRGGEAGRRTQERAIALAKERGTELIFLCVFDPNFAGSLSKALSAAVEEEQQWLGRSLVSVAQARAQEQDVEAGAVVLSGVILDSIEEFLCESGASTLVIGEAKIDSALSAFRHGMVQSCARHVEQNTGVEVVVVTPVE